MIMGFWHENYCTQRTKTKSFAHHTIPMLHIIYLKAPNCIQKQNCQLTECSENDLYIIPENFNSFIFHSFKGL